MSSGGGAGGSGSDGEGTPGSSPAAIPPSMIMTKQENQVIVGLSWFLTSVAMVVVMLRFWARAKLLRGLYWDDWFMLLAMIFQVAYEALITKSFASVTPGPAGATFINPLVFKWGLLSMWPATLASITARISASILLIRIFGTKLWFKWYLIVLTSIQTVVGILALVLFATELTPIEAKWDPTVPHVRHFGPEVPTNVATTTAAFFTWSDITYVLLPTIIIWKLNMPTRRKVGLVLLMCMSLLTMTASIIKAVATLSRNTTFKPLESFLWASIEQNFGIIMASIPPLVVIARIDHPAIHYINSIFGKLVSKKSSSSGSSRPPYQRNSSNKGGRVFNKDAGYQDMNMNLGSIGRNHSMAEKDSSGLTAMDAAEMRGAKNSQSDCESYDPGSAYEQNHIFRTDQFSVTYSQGNSVPKHQQYPREGV